MKEGIMHLLKLNNKIFRTTQVYLDKLLKEYGLSSGSYPYLLILMENEGISQNQISKELGCDKAMSTRTIIKLIKLGYLDRKEDEDDSRAYKLFLTDKAKDTIPKVLKEIYGLVHLITADLSDQEKSVTIDSLSKVLDNIKNMKIEE